jgi:hypothetical protein
MIDASFGLSARAGAVKLVCMKVQYELLTPRRVTYMYTV